VQDHYGGVTLPELVDEPVMLRVAANWYEQTFIDEGSSLNTIHRATDFFVEVTGGPSPETNERLAEGWNASLLALTLRQMPDRPVEVWFSFEPPEDHMNSLHFNEQVQGLAAVSSDGYPLLEPFSLVTDSVINNEDGGSGAKTDFAYAPTGEPLNVPEEGSCYGWTIDLLIEAFATDATGRCTTCSGPVDLHYTLTNPCLDPIEYAKTTFYEEDPTEECLIWLWEVSGPTSVNGENPYTSVDPGLDGVIQPGEVLEGFVSVGEELEPGEYSGAITSLALGLWNKVEFEFEVVE
jgi:hypothetical protein